ncbi:ribonuclease M5 [Ureaplasma sp. ES3154-GEN]|uniref:ribonuclease M5 n=1 Tax=Ureaplasma sp. ES3154-GEN TaxID=2984844 RepID=UPI0021E6EAD2|nr:ribonuclease M5 [Ureaplasma sp. ES3154-GEN]MCV3743415.1 ribonuclease M5 [Ureaplasma sp. ES3154-GEN]
MFKRQIKEVIVVEGKTDQQKLASLFDADFIITNGSEINKETLALIDQVNKTRGVILFLDPDYQGERIRKIITQYIKTPLKQCFIKKTDMKNKVPKKIGIAEANSQVLYETLLKHSVIFNQNLDISLSWSDYLNLKLDNKQKRILLCEALHISYANHKQLYKRLVMMRFSFEQIQELLIAKGIY